MDIARYIGLFLLKNEQCYVSGLGTLQLLRKPATYDGQHLQPATHEINIVPGGNVDEALANFIATNEQVSITKASNALKEFSANTKGRLQAGETVALPYLGSFTADDGRVGFITTPALQYKAAPIRAQRGISVTQEKERPSIPHQPFIPSSPPVGTATPPPVADGHVNPQPPVHRKRKLNWARIIFVMLLLIVLAGAAYYGYERYLAPKSNRSAKPVLTLPEEFDEEDMQEEDPFNEEGFGMADTSDILDTALTAPVQQNENAASQQGNGSDNQTPGSSNTRPGNNTAQPIQQQQPATTPPATTTAPAKPKGRTINLKMVLNTYDSKAAAYRRKNELAAKGNNAEVIEEDVNYYFVVMPVSVSPADSGRVRDSLTRKFNPEGGVFIY